MQDYHLLALSTIAYGIYSTWNSRYPVTQEEYLQRLYQQKVTLTTGWFSIFRLSVVDELKYLNAEIVLTEAKLKTALRPTECTQCLRKTSLPSGQDICSDCLRPVVAAFYSGLSNYSS
jgi:hypothetical protein